MPLRIYVSRMRHKERNIKRPCRHCGAKAHKPCKKGCGAQLITLRRTPPNSFAG